jgi:uncharacterized protein YggE
MNSKLQKVVLLTTGILVLGVPVMKPAAVAAQQETAARSGSILLVEHPVDQPTDRIEFHLAVSNFATNVTAAHSASALAVQRVLRALAGSGVQVDEVQPEGIILVPEYAPLDPVPLRGIRADPRVVGYRAVGEIRVVTRDSGRLPLLLDAARGAGAHPVRSVYLP